MELVVLGANMDLVTVGSVRMDNTIASLDVPVGVLDWCGKSQCSMAFERNVSQIVDKPCMLSVESQLADRG